MPAPLVVDLEEMVTATYCALDDALAEADIKVQDGKLIARSGPAPEVDDREILCLLGNGKVLLAAGSGKECELYDPATGEWSPVASTNDYHEWGETVLLTDGRVMAVGGIDGYASEIYDPTQDTWTQTGYLNHRRTFPKAILGPNGTVLVVGGTDLSTYPIETLSSCEIFDPVLGEWTLTDSRADIRGENHTLTLLSGGRVLVAGGTDYDWENGSGIIWATCELYPFPVVTIDPDESPYEGGETALIEAAELGGGGFVDDGLISVRFGEYEASILHVQDSTHLLVVIPRHDIPPGGTWTPTVVDVVVSYPNSTDLHGTFTYQNACGDVQIDSVHPNRGSYAGYEVVYIFGQGFTSDVDTTVTFGGIPATEFYVLGPNDIFAIVPPREAPPGVGGRWKATPVDVTVANACGSATLPGGYTYQDDFPGVDLYVVDPPEGPFGGGTAVTLYGQGFSGGGGSAASGGIATTVTFGGIPATEVKVVDENTIQAVTPACQRSRISLSQPYKSADVTVTTPNSTATLKDGFTYRK